MTIRSFQDEAGMDQATLFLGSPTFVAELAGPAVMGTDVKDEPVGGLAFTLDVSPQSEGVVFPALEREGLVEIVELARRRLVKKRRTGGGGNLDPHKVGALVVRDCRRGTDKALAELDAQVAVELSNKTNSSLKAPDCHHRPVVVVVLVVLNGKVPIHMSVRSCYRVWERHNLHPDAVEDQNASYNVEDQEQLIRLCA